MKTQKISWSLIFLSSFLLMLSLYLFFQANTSLLYTHDIIDAARETYLTAFQGVNEMIADFKNSSIPTHPTQKEFDAMIIQYNNFLISFRRTTFPVLLGSKLSSDFLMFFAGFYFFASSLYLMRRSSKAINACKKAVVFLSLSFLSIGIFFELTLRVIHKIDYLLQLSNRLYDNTDYNIKELFPSHWGFFPFLVLSLFIILFIILPRWWITRPKIKDQLLK